MAAKLVGKWYKNSSKKIPKKEDKLFLIKTSENDICLVIYSEEVFKFIDYWGTDLVPIEDIEILYWSEVSNPSKDLPLEKEPKNLHKKMIDRLKKSL